MTSPELERLVLIGQLKREPGAQEEIDGLVRSARSRLTDARYPALSLESRFDLAYNAAHALSLAALRWRGYGGCSPPVTSAAIRSNMKGIWKRMSVSWPISFKRLRLSTRPSSDWVRS